MGNATGGNVSGGFGGGAGGGGGGFGGGGALASYSNLGGGRPPRDDARRIGTLDRIVRAKKAGWLLGWRVKAALRAGCRAACAGMDRAVSVHAAAQMHPHRGGTLRVIVHVTAHAADYSGSDLPGAMKAFAAAFDARLRPQS